jgi:hypothetical protein
MMRSVSIAVITRLERINIRLDTGRGVKYKSEKYKSGKYKSGKWKSRKWKSKKVRRESI